jgi:hypothetical protein
VISVDTFQSAVARAAVEAGADMVNDVSGGLLDPTMHSTVSHNFAFMPFSLRLVVRITQWGSLFLESLLQICRALS